MIKRCGRVRKKCSFAWQSALEIRVRGEMFETRTDVGGGRGAAKIVTWDVDAVVYLADRAGAADTRVRSKDSMRSKLVLSRHCLSESWIQMKDWLRCSK